MVRLYTSLISFVLRGNDFTKDSSDSILIKFLLISVAQR